MSYDPNDVTNYWRDQAERERWAAPKPSVEDQLAKVQRDLDHLHDEANRLIWIVSLIVGVLVSTLTVWALS